MHLCASPVTPLPDDQFLNLNCTQNPTNGNLLVPKDGCPPKAAANPGKVICPLTNVIHPNFDSKICVTVPVYANGADVAVYVACMIHLMIVEPNFICIAYLAQERTIRSSFLGKEVPLSFKQREPISAWMHVSF